MWLPDGPPIARIGADTRDRWLVRDVKRGELEAFLNAACALGWTLDEWATITEADPPLGEEIVRVVCSATLPTPRKKRAAKKVPVVAD